MRIAMFTNNYKPFIGGVPISIERLALGLRALGHVVYVFAPDYGNYEKEEFVIRYKTINQKKQNGIMIGNCFDPRLEKQFQALGFDIIHVHHPMISGHMALYLGRKYRVPVAYTYHTRYEEYLHYVKFFQMIKGWGWAAGRLTRYSRKVLVPKYMTLFTNRCDLIFAPTQMMKEHLEQHSTKTPVEILPTGLNDSAFMENPIRSDKIRRQYMDGKKYLFSTISRLGKEKNLDFLLLGVSRLKEKIGDCFRIMVIGEGSEMTHLMEYAGELHISDNLIFVGKVPNDEIADYQFASDAFLFASKSETQGIVLLEAMAAASPVIAVRASGVVDIVKHGYNGYMTDESADAWAQAVIDTVTVPADYEKLRENAVRTAGGYRASEIARRAECAYYKVVAQGCEAQDYKTQKREWQKKGWYEAAYEKPL